MQAFWPITLLKSGSNTGVLMSTWKGRREKSGTKERGKIFQMREENKTILFYFYGQVLVLVKTEMQIQLCEC